MSELTSFHEFLGKKISEFGTVASPEEMLDLWRATHPCESEFQDDLKAVQSAFDEMKAGDIGVPLDDFDLDFRKKHSVG